MFENMKPQVNANLTTNSSVIRTSILVIWRDGNAVYENTTTMYLKQLLHAILPHQIQISISNMFAVYTWEHYWV